MQSNSVNGQPDIANITVVTDERQVIVPQAITSVVEVNNPGPQGPVGPQGEAGPSVPFTNIGNDVYATTSSLQVTGSFLVSGSSTFTNIGPAIFSGSTAISGSLIVNGYDVITVNQTSSMSVATASYLNTLNQDLTFNGNLTLNGTASIGTLVVNQTVLSTGSNQLGDSANDTQTLYGTVVVPTGSLTVSGSVSFGTSSAGFYWNNTNSRLGIGTAIPISELSVASVNGITLQSGVIMPNLHRDNTDGSFLIRSYNTGTSTYTTNVKVRSNGNFLINTTTDAGYRLDVNGSTRVKGSGTTSATTALRVENTNASASLVVLDDGAVGIGTTSPSSSILLDVSGSIRSFSILPAANGSYDLGVSANRFRNGWFAGSLIALTGYFSNLFFGVTNLGIYNSTSTQIAQMFGTGDLVLQSGGTFTNNNYRLQVNATGSNSGSLFLGGTTIATGSIARTMLISSSLSASANNDVLVGLDINPTFTNGAFTGVKNNWINLVGNASVNFTNQLYLKRGDVDVLFASSLETQLKTVSSSSPLKFFVGSTSQYAQFFATTGNLTLQNGGTFTDEGYRLDVNGTIRVQNHLFISSGFAVASLGNNVNLRSNLIGGSGYVINAQSYNTLNSSQNEQGFGEFTGTYAPTSVSGTPSFNALKLTPTINQTGGANGITRGLYINPTLTAAADFRAIETTAGNVLFQSGSTPLLFVSSSGNVGIRTSTPTNTLDIVSTTTGSLRISGSAGSQITLVRPTSGLSGYVRYLGSSMDIGTNSSDNFRLNTNNTTRINIADTGFVGIGIGTSAPSSLLQVRGSGATSATTSFLVQNSTPTNLLSVLDNGQVSFTSPTMSLAVSQSAFSISPIISASNIVGGQYYGISITPTFYQTTGSQTETAFRVAATFTSSNATATSGSNIIADFGSTSAGSQLTVTDVTSGSIYMVNDVSGIPIIEATSNWDVNIYDFPNKIFEKTGSQVNIYGTMRISGSFILPLSQSVAPQTGSAYWSGSLLFIYDGTRYRSSSFA